MTRSHRSAGSISVNRSRPSLSMSRRHLARTSLGVWPSSCWRPVWPTPRGSAYRPHRRRPGLGASLPQCRPSARQLHGEAARAQSHGRAPHGLHLPDRIAIAKANDIVDAWATLERLRVLANAVWSRRAQIVPSDELRRRPPFIEIYKRLPGTNCKLCGEATCMAFAASVWRGDADPRLCLPVFDGERGDLRDALLSICSGLGLASD